MNVSTKIYERRGLLSAYETIQTILGFGMFTIALIALIVKLLKEDKRNDRCLTCLVRRSFQNLKILSPLVTALH